MYPFLQYKEHYGHCRVPKGYSKDAELANWVRNQRLEEANKRKGKKTRMTDERFEALDELGIIWSSFHPSRSKKKKKRATQEGPTEAPVADENAAANNGEVDAIKEEEKMDDEDENENMEPPEGGMIGIGDDDVQAVEI